MWSDSDILFEIRCALPHNHDCVNEIRQLKVAEEVRPPNPHRRAGLLKFLVSSQALHFL